MKQTTRSKRWRRVVVLPTGLIAGLSLVAGCAVVERALGQQAQTGHYSGLEFRPVLMVGPAVPGDPDQVPEVEQDGELAASFAALDCSDGVQAGEVVDAGPDHAVVACDVHLEERFALGPVALDGSMVDSTQIKQTVHHDGTRADDYSVGLVFTAEGTQALERVTADLSRLDDPLNRMAMMVGQEVLSAPTVLVPLGDGELILAGGFTESQAQDIVAAFSVAQD